MKEKPILFSGPMVRAILDGRKTQTRRVVSAKSDLFRFTHPDFGCKTLDNGRTWVDGVGSGPVWQWCPYGREGDRLWVKETFARVHPGMLQSLDPDPDSPMWETVYRADCNGGYVSAMTDRSGWKPSIFMPRKFSRITLEIVSVRVERLQEISEADAAAEGVDFPSDELTTSPASISTCAFYCGDVLKLEYARLWESINGTGSWAKNPWVWVIEFKKV